MKVLQFPKRTDDEPIACPIGLALWHEYRRLHPDGVKVPPIASEQCKDPALNDYCNHVATCEDCNEV